MMKPRPGISASSAMKVLLPMPQIQLRKKAPQFQRRISGGMVFGSKRTAVSLMIWSCGSIHIRPQPPKSVTTGLDPVVHAIGAP
jgi:hypothetical protein